MALNPEQRARVRYWLGWPAARYSSTDALEQAMDTLANYAHDEANAVQLLVALEQLDEQIAGNVVTGTKAVQVGAIQIRGAYQLGTLAHRGKMLANRLAAILGVSVQRDAFGVSGVSGTYLAEG